MSADATVVGFFSDMKVLPCLVEKRQTDGSNFGRRSTNNARGSQDLPLAVMLPHQVFETVPIRTPNIRQNVSALKSIRPKRHRPSVQHLNDVSRIGATAQALAG
jgi:hypothetical protein